MTEYRIKFYNVLTQDESLKKLLIHVPTNEDDDPLLKVNIGDDWNKIEKVIKKSNKVDDLEKEAICRVCMYPGNRTVGKENYFYAGQDIIFDVYAHIDTYDNIDFRLSTICDHLNKLVVNKNRTGISKTTFLAGQTITTPPSGYVGYRLYYRFGTSTK